MFGGFSVGDVNFLVVFIISVGFIFSEGDSIGPGYHPIICRKECLSTHWYLSFQLKNLLCLFSAYSFFYNNLGYIDFIPFIATSCLLITHNCIIFIYSKHISHTNVHTTTKANQQPSVHHLADQLESTSIDESPTVRRVIVHFIHALSRGMAEWEFAAVGKLYADGELIPRAAEREARVAWSHLRSREGNWRFILIGLEPNIYAIKFDNEDDQNSILYGTAWKFYNNLVVLRQWTTSTNYRDLDFSSQKFWMDFKRLLPEFFNEEMIQLFAEIVGQVLYVEVPESGTKFRALIEISLGTPHLTGIHTANGLE